jgi:hypothetical protein
MTLRFSSHYEFMTNALLPNSRPQPPMRTRLLALLLCSFGASASAQSLPKSVLIADYERTKTNLMAYIEVAPDSMMGFMPTKGVRTFAQQIQHIVASDVDAAAVGIRGLAKSPVLGDTAKFLHSKAALKAYALASYDYAIAALREATPEQMERKSSMYRLPPEPAWRWMQLAHEHSVWTFGQIIPYLRLNGVTPPAYSLPF